MTSRIFTFSALAAVIAVIVLGSAATYSIAEWRPIASGLQPTLIFDSREEHFPTTIDFDGDTKIWNNAESYERTAPRPPVVARTHEVKYDTFAVIQFWYYYVRNEGATINFHDHDEEHANVYVRDGEPFLLVLYAHGSPTIHRVQDELDLWSFVGWGSHGMTQSRFDPLVLNDGLGERFFDYDLQLLLPELELEPIITDANGFYLTSQAGDLIPPPYSSIRDNDQYWDPALEVIGTEFESDLELPSAVPLSAVAALPSVTDFLFLSAPIALATFLLGFFGDFRVWKVTAIIGLLFLLGVVALSYMTFSAELLPLSMWVSVFRTVPYILLAVSLAFVSSVLRLGLTNPKELQRQLPKLQGFGIVMIGVTFGMWQTQVVTWSWPIGLTVAVSGFWILGKVLK